MGYSCRTLFQKSRCEAARRAFRTRLPAKVTRQVSKASISYETSSKSHTPRLQNVTRDTSMKSHLQKLPPMALNLRRDDDDKRRETTRDDERRRHDASHANTAPTPRPPTINGNPSLRIREKEAKAKGSKGSSESSFPLLNSADPGVSCEDPVPKSPHWLGELATLLIAHVAGRRANEARHGELLHVLAHVHADQGLLKLAFGVQEPAAAAAAAAQQPS